MNANSRQYVRRVCQITSRWVLLCVLLVGMVAPSDAYLPPGPVEEGWPADVALIYNSYIGLQGKALTQYGGYEQDGIARTDDGDWLKGDFLPFIAHLDASGKPHDTFFDSFLFLAGKSHRTREFGGEVEQHRAALWADWQWYIDRIFNPGHQIDALDQAVGELGETLGDPGYTVNVYIMIPYPSYKVTDFGHPDGSMGGFSLLPWENRQKVVEWYVDEVLARWQALSPAHLRLAGFYWLQEHVNPSVPDEELFVRTAVRYVQDKGYLMSWIPWSGAMYATHWKSYGFDWAIIQPNRILRDKPDDIEVAVGRATRSRMGIEVEFDGRIKQIENELKFYEYLDGGVKYGYMTEAMIGYYMDLSILSSLYHDGDGRWRHLYDDLYAFAKGTYPSGPDASLAIRGVVVDDTGAPVGNAVVRSGGRATHTTTDGAFLLDGLYVNEANVLIAKDGYAGVLQKVPTTRKDSGPPVHSFVLRASEGKVLHAFDSAQGLGRLGFTFTVTSDNYTQGDHAVMATPMSGSLKSMWVSVSTKDQDMSGYGAIGVDVYVDATRTEALQMTLLDRGGKTYSRTLHVQPGTWNTLWIALDEAASGAHNQPLIEGAPGDIDLTRISRVTLVPVSESSEPFVFDNLRLVAR